jgi:hypothetical protein
MECKTCGAELPQENMLGAHYFWSDCVAYLKAEITRLQSEARWIPVSERLPELKTDDLVLCVIKNDMRGTWVDTRTFWVASKLFSGSSQVTHWKYLPTPPTEG